MTEQQTESMLLMAERIGAAAQALSELANLNGMVLTIECRPERPLAMGHYSIVIGVRPSHEAYRSQA
jgi:hypothetical protein